MASTAAKLFKAYMDSKEMNCEIVDDEESVVRVGWKLDNTRISLFFFFDEEDNYVHIDGVDFLEVPKDKYDLLLKVVNDCNDNYRWVKFVLDAENEQVVAKVDAVIQLDSCAEEVYELMVRTAQIVDDSYPKFMKAMWA